jgi:hypothetical protein
MIVLKDKTFVILAVCVGAFALALLSRFYLTGNFMHVLNVARVAGRAVMGEMAGSGRENFMQKEIGAPVDGSGTQGVYSGIDISNGNSWSESKAPVDVKGYEAHDDNELFQYQNDKFTPECCATGSTSISNDVGCLCLSKKQEKELGYRGGNRKSS